MGKPSAIGQPTRLTQPFILSGSINEQSYAHCPSTPRRRLSRRSCQHAWTTATVSRTVLLTDWCNGFRLSRTPPHVWSPALDGATTCHIACSPAAALASSPPTSSVQAGSASVQSAAWASPTALDGRLSTRFRCRPPSTTVV